MPPTTPQQDPPPPATNPTPLTIKQTKRKIRSLLRGLTPEQFLRTLEFPARNHVYYRRLTQPHGYILVKDPFKNGDSGTTNPTLKDSAILRDEHAMTIAEDGHGIDIKGSMVMQEAREYYYSENMFLIDVGWLGDWVEYLEERKCVGFVKDLTVVVDVPTKGVDDDGEKLKVLEKFGKAKVEIHIFGEDAEVATKVEEIREVVVGLRGIFGEKLRVVHVKDHDVEVDLGKEFGVVNLFD